MLFAYHRIFSSFFPNENGLLGHDFSLTLPELLDGYIWFKNNSLFDVPWFTPSFCGGQPFFADTQSIYYSVPQFLAFWTDPLGASYLTLLIFAAIGFWGFYLLMRQVFSAGWEASAFAGAVFMFNGFLSHRLITGQYAFHGITLIPWVALLLLHPREFPAGAVRRGGNAVGAGILIAYWLHSGLTTLMMPVGLSVFALACVYWLSGGRLWPFFIRSLGAALVALALCISKLVASLSFFSNFQRSSYLLPGVDGIVATFTLIFKSLFYSSQSVAQSALASMRNVQWAVEPHEWAYGLTLIPLFILIVGAGAYVLRLGSSNGTSLGGLLRRRSLVILVMLCLALALPLALNTYSPAWNAFLKQVPVIKSASLLLRWLIVYIPFVVLLAALVLDRVPMPQRLRSVLLALSLIGLVTLNALERREYYQTQPYNPSAIQQAYKEIASGQSTPHIHSVGVTLSQQGVVMSVDRNDAMTKGYSQLACYNPAFGYRLEVFPFKDLHPGPILSETGGHLNIKNPACYVWPVENGCAPGDHFLVSQRPQAEAFSSYRPFAFNKSRLQQTADTVTIVALVTLCGLAIAWVFVILFRLVRESASGGGGK